MRIHTNKLSWKSLHLALLNAQADGNIAAHVELIKSDECGSRSHARAFEVRLGTDYKEKSDKRTFLNSGNHGAASSANGYEGVYSATYDEWGWFLAALYKMDPTIKCAGMYDNAEHFHRRTENKYVRQSTDVPERTA